MREDPRDREHRLIVWSRHGYDVHRQRWNRRPKGRPYRKRPRPVRRAKSRSRKRFRTNRSKKRSRKSRGITRQKILNLIAVPQVWTQEIAQSVTVPASTVAHGAGVIYFTAGCPDRAASGLLANNMSLYAIQSLFRIQIEHIDNTAGSLNYRWYVTRANLEYKLQNVHQGYVDATAYICRVRRDVPWTSTLSDLRLLLNQGFVDNGYGDFSTFPLGVDQEELTPFQSSTFTNYFKIQRAKRFRMHPGRMRRFVLKSSRCRTINMGDYVDPANQTQTYLTSGIQLAFQRGDRFILFKFRGQLATDFVNHVTIATTTPQIILKTVQRLTWKNMEHQTRHIDVNAPFGFKATTIDMIVQPDSGLIVSPANA